MESILTSIKKLLGIEEDYIQFDTDVIIGINSALMNLNQLGIGPTEGFVVVDKTQNWTDLIGTRTDSEAVKLYVYFKTRLAFDPPQNSFLVEAINKQITELEWRLNVQAEGGTV
jgi:hypothetical protein